MLSLAFHDVGANQPFNYDTSEPTMSMSAAEILDREFLEVRARILEIAAALDRQDRAAGDVAADQRRCSLEAGIAILAADGRERADRAKRVQLLFSREYDPAWRTEIRQGDVRGEEPRMDNPANEAT